MKQIEEFEYNGYLCKITYSDTGIVGYHPTVCDMDGNYLASIRGKLPTIERAREFCYNHINLTIERESKVKIISDSKNELPDWETFSTNYQLESLNEEVKTYAEKVKDINDAGTRLKERLASLEESISKAKKSGNLSKMKVYELKKELLEIQTEELKKKYEIYTLENKIKTSV